MNFFNTTSRRTFLKTGLSAAATGALASPKAIASFLSSGQTRVLFLGGDYYHCAVPMEVHWREVLHSTNWRLLFAQSSQFVTPDLLREIDLFVLIRGEGPDILGWSPDPLIEMRPLPAPFMTDAQEEAIVENVHRGMGLLCMHSSTRHPGREKYLKLIGVEQQLNHGPLQRIKFHSLNQNHPITQGLKDFEVDIDQTRHAIVNEDEVTVLFRSTGEKDNAEDVMGWCVERGKGRIVALLPGHYPPPAPSAQYKQIMWRAAHWALHRDIPYAEFKNGIP